MSPQVLHALALVPMVCGAAMRRVERRTMARVADAAATTPERAVMLEQAGRIGGFVQSRLQRNGVLIEAGNGRYYFSPAAYEAFRDRRRKRALLIISIAVVLTGVLYWGNSS
jgi:hypothetical protein